MVFTLGIGESVDDIAETQQPHVDINALPQCRPSGPCFFNPLRARKIHKMELSHHTALLLIALSQRLLLDANGEYGMGPRTRIVHQGR